MLTPDDYTYLHDLEKKDSHLKDILARYEEENNFILSRMNHEIRNPLTLINSTMQLMSHKAPELKESKYWNQMGEDMEDLFSLLDGLSRFTHSEELRYEQCNLIQMLTQLKISFEPFAKEKNTSITIIIKQGVHDIASDYNCDSIKLKQVFTNLLKNAIEAIHKESGNIQIILDTDNEHSFSIHIIDNGEGIPVNMLDQIFTPFITSKQGGSGLGLPTAKRIILSHGGNISVNCLDGFTDFHIQLPI
ncbi:sensor histidine kinase [Lachnospiraceae bacterium KM106-2]|nr:sensor histidine kinase [Lachnospiraceae bacterium KM106-2]